MGRVSGQVAFITGAARGQGRSHALRLAEEGADIVAIDIAGQIDSVPFPMSTPQDLAETVKLVQARGQRVIGRQLDVRDQQALDAVVAETMEEFGNIDIVAANAAIFGMASNWEISERQWNDVIDVNLTGVWHTVKAVVPSMIAARRGGSIVLTNSAAGLRASPYMAAYTAAKHGVVGIMRSLAQELGQFGIRVNSVHPSAVATPMILNDWFLKEFLPESVDPGRDEIDAAFGELHALPVGVLDPIHISNAVLWLSSDEAQYITGVALPVDAGYLIK